jgi:hypothetical protein
MWQIRGYACQEDYIADIVADEDDPRRIEQWEDDERWYRNRSLKVRTIPDNPYL